MSARHVVTVVLLNVAVSVALLSVYALRFAPPAPPRLAVLDVAELYRLKESQVAAVLVKRDGSDTERMMALKRAQDFGTEVTAVIQTLLGECRCLILARGAVVSDPTLLPDLTAQVRQRLGL